MADTENPHQLRNGLPHCISRDQQGFDRLKRILGLSRDTCRNLLDTARKNVTSFPRAKLSRRLSASDRDRLLLLELYQDKTRRYKYWAHIFSLIESGKDKEIARKPPSLEHRLLTDHLNDFSTEKRDSLQSLDVFADWPDLAQHLTDTVPWADFTAYAWAATLKRLTIDTWDPLDPDQRAEVSMTVFSIATIVDDDRILRSAISAIPDLAAEYDDILQTTPVSDDVTETGAAPEEDSEIADTVKMEDKTESNENEVLNTWTNLCESLGSLANEAKGPPPIVDTLPQIRTVVDELSKIAQRAKARTEAACFDDLISRVRAYLDDSEPSHGSSLIGTTERAKLDAAWESERASLSIKTIGDEINRLEESVPTGLKRLDDVTANLSAAQAKLDTFFATGPSDLASYQSWASAADESRTAVAALQNDQFQATLDLLSRLSPLGRRYSPDAPPQHSPPDHDTPSSPTPPAPESDTSTTTKPDPTEPHENEPDGDPSGTVSEQEPSASVAPAAPTTPNDSTHQHRISIDAEQPIDTSDNPAVATPLSETGQPVSDAEPHADTLSKRAMEKIAAALRETPPQLAYAFQVARLLAQFSTDTAPLLVPILKAAMLSDCLNKPDGAIADEVTRTLPQFPPPDLIPQTDDARDAYATLAVAATLRPALLSPHTGAYSLLSAIQPTKRLAHVYRFTDAVARECHKLQTVRIDSTVIEAATTPAKWQDHRDRLAADAKEWWDNARHMTIKYAPATVVWQRWLDRSGPIATIMDLIISCAENNTEVIKNTIHQLTDRDQFRALVRDTDRNLGRGRPRKKDIHARALDQLHHHAKDAVEYAARHLRLLDSRPSPSSFITQTLTILGRTASAHRQPACDELQHLLSNSMSSVTAAAANTAIYAIKRFLDLFDYVPDAEPHPTALVGSALLRFPSISVDNDGFPRGDPRRAIDVLITTSPATLQASFDRRLVMRDFDTSRRIITWIDANEEDDTIALTDRWKKILESEKRKLRTEIDDSRTKVSNALARGHISEPDRDALDAVLFESEQTLADEQMVVFDQTRLTLRGIADRLEKASEDRRTRATQDLSDLALPPDAGEHIRISALIGKGDTVEANELIAQIRDGSPPRQLSPESSRELFREFYPERCEAIRSAIEAEPSAHRVLNAIGTDAEFGGMPLHQLPGSRRKSARRMLEAWFELKRRSHLDETAREKLATTLFIEMGFDVQRMEFVRSGRNVGEAIMQTIPSRTRERCPIPLFGSHAEGRYRVVFLTDLPTPEDLLQHSDESPRRAATILLYFGRLTQRQRERIAFLARNKQQSLLIVDELMLVFLCGERESRVPVLFACAIPFTYAQPYVTTAGLVPPEMFYGRQEEMRQVADPFGSCFVYGGRQLGKTALLRAVERQEHSPTDGRYAIWIDLKGQGVGYDHDRTAAHVWSSIWSALRRLGPRHCPMPDTVKEPVPVRNRAQKFVEFLTSHFNPDTGRVLLLLLDEADRFLETDAREEDGPGTAYRESSRLKDLMEQTGRSIKVVFAGLHNVLRTVEYSNHPLGHLGEPIQVRPLWYDAEALIREPLLAAGYRFENDNLVTRILAQTNYYPNLIQLYCSELVKSMRVAPLGRGPLYNIGEAVLDATFQKSNLRDMIRQRFHMTLQLDPRYEVIAYAIAYECHQRSAVLSKGLDYRDIDRISRNWWSEGFDDVEPYTDLFRSLLDEMVGLGVLREAANQRYTLRNPNLLPFMGTDSEIGDNLLRERVFPPQLQRESFRAHDPENTDGPSRSPLSYEQARRLRSSKNGVSVVCGVRAGGFDRVLHFLRHRDDSDFCIEIRSPSDHLEFEEELGGLFRRRKEGTTIYAVPDSVDWNGAWVREALRRTRRLESEGKYARVLFMAEPSRLFELRRHLDALTKEGLQWVALRPWGEEFLHHWMNDVGFDDTPDIRRRVVEVTGGWPIFLERLYGLFRVRGSLKDGITSLEEEMLSRRDRFLGDFGLDEPTRKKLLLCLAQLEEAEFSGLEELANDEGVDREFLLRTLEWAELLHLACNVENDVWRVDDSLARLLTSGE